MTEDPSLIPPAQTAWAIVSAAFAALGRAFICVDEQFRVIHASFALDELLGPGASQRAEGRALEELLGPELFGASGALTQALGLGERREGWRAHLRLDDSEHRLVSLSAAPFMPDPTVGCDPRVRHVVVVRPAEEDPGASLGAPTAIGGFIARSPAMARVFALIENLSHSDATVLVSGESGTGKEILARAIHAHSPRARGPFVAVNCGALPTGLLESEMFGHARGAFTGAVRDRVGRFELASEGTLFLDEVGDLPLELQVKLLRALQDGTFERLGENHTRTSRARVIAATHVNLADAVREGRFREDLYYRLRVVPIEIPPLRERREDLEPLAHAVLSRVGARQGRALRFSPEALRVLLEYDWPGNVRELENVLEYAVAVCRGQTLLPEDLPSLEPSRGAPPHAPATADAGRAGSAAPEQPATPAPGQAPSPEVLRGTLERHRWRRAEAARALGVSRTTLWRWMREAGLH
ncbi:MAG TPA: sigma 54-interacting transcriptional regulator [Candidatus Eisenbacteria bacterium]